MNDFEGLLASDFGFKPQGKSAPMAASKSSPTLNPTSDINFGLGSRPPPQPTWTSDQGSIFGSASDRKVRDFDDLGSGSAAGFATQSQSSRFYSAGSDFESAFGLNDFSAAAKTTSASGFGSAEADFESAFSGFSDFNAAKSSSGSGLHDKPVYDDDIFDGLPGLNSTSGEKYQSAFSSFSSMPKGGGGIDDFLGGFGKSETEVKSSNGGGSGSFGGGSVGFEDLIPGFGQSSPPKERTTSGPSWHSEPTFSAGKTTPDDTENPFVVLESSSTAATSSPKLFTDPLEEISKPDNSGSLKVDKSSLPKGKTYDDMDPFNDLGKFAPTYTSDKREMKRDDIPFRTDQGTNEGQTYADKEPHEQTTARSPEESSVSSDQEIHEPIFDIPKVSAASHKSVGRAASPPLYANAGADFNETDLHHVDMSSGSEERSDSFDDVWLTVSEIPLSTEPTRAPPPSRAPPPRPTRVTKDKSQPFSSTSDKRKDTDSSYFNSRSSAASPFDDFEDFTSGGSKKEVNYPANGLSSEDFEMSSTAAASAAAMKDAMERAEAKFRHAKEVRVRETTKSSRSREQLDNDEKAMKDAQDRAHREKQERSDHERIQREMEEEERLHKRLEKERERVKEIEREREEKEREQRRLDKERERAREIEREREHARQAVQRATREARERAAAEARLKAERAAVGKINAETRERAERVAVQRAQAEARERQAAEAKERAEKVAAEARERANSEAREKDAQERAAAAKATAEARLRAERSAVQRAAQEARERAAAAARLNQQKNENDLDSFFNMGRASSAPRPRATPSDPMFDSQFHNKQGPGVPKTSGASSSMKKASSATNITDDLASIFGGAPSSKGDFPDVEGETEERRRARMERHQRTQERAAKALAEKNNRDLQAQMDQAERHRISETLDIEIKRWAAGKEGNLRALLATLQYVLWPECGWQPVSLSDLITAAMVKKVYRKSTLCIHPDKVQQKGATLQQKYVAEKVFDILKEAWNKFNSDELF